MVGQKSSETILEMRWICFHSSPDSRERSSAGDSVPKKSSSMSRMKEEEEEEVKRGDGIHSEDRRRLA